MLVYWQVINTLLKTWELFYFLEILPSLELKYLPVERYYISHFPVNRKSMCVFRPMYLHFHFQEKFVKVCSRI